MKTYLFTVVVEEDSFEDGRMAYHAYCPALKGANTWSYTSEEALKNIREVIEMTIESMRERGESIPEEPGVQIFPEPKVAVTV
ncbi:MAG: type II toxin-antitoxin system HicB family antitoxin [Chloroflexota bacterium]|nr:type II toxin-antitoxin system HicB family antitoxin [Chloroflexota bacterium]